MLPLHQSYEIRESIISYLKATFSFNDERLEQAFDELVKDTKKGLFKGPYLSMKLPYVTADLLEVQACPLEIKPDWPPYDHQIKSWNRLSIETKAKPTIITTGTGSGKTESFLYPLLDYCHKHKDKKGIKAIILYPMNALATDQAKRLAEAIHEDSRLNGIRAGLFIGMGQGNKKDFPSAMSAERIIENRDAILDSPPDILLTNFKMLDYGLMRAKYQKLWKHNLENVGTLQFLVLDELHTYDGAQGTDVANLIRRLKLKLNMPTGQLCPVGTSATIGAGEESKQDLASYASKLFGESVTEECIITENRKQILEFFGVKRAEDLRAYSPTVSDLDSCEKALNESVENYNSVVKRSWNIDQDATGLEISKALLTNRFFYFVLNACREGVVSISDLILKLDRASRDFRTIPEWDEEGQFYPRIALIESLLALVSIAKSGPNGRFPLVNTQIQLWIRELSKLMRAFDTEPAFIWDDSVYKQKPEIGLPPYFCRECGASGWIGMKPDNHNKFSKDRKKISTEFINKHKNIWLINESKVKAVEEYKPTEFLVQSINKYSLEFTDGGDPENDMTIIAYRKVKGTKTEHFCPECNSKNTLAIIGTRIATLSSVAISQNLSTDLDPTSEKYRKVLAFTNSVQDAAHQAGFVEARNYRFTFRSSLQEVINKLNKPVTLAELGEEFIKYWSTKEEEYYWRFFPSDYIGKATPNSFKDNGVITDEFRKEFHHRMTWQVYEEFGHRALIGRTLEKSQSSAVYISTKKLAELYNELQPWLLDNNLTVIEERVFEPFMALVLYRIRIKGGISHRYLSKARKGKMNMWDLNWTKDGTHFLNPKYYENSSRFPKIINTDSKRQAIADTTYTSSINWFHQYFIKTFPMAPANKELINEFYDKLFDSCTVVDITDKVHGNDTVSYALSPEAVIVSKSNVRYKCDSCNSKIVTGDASTMLDGAKCINYRCTTGLYHIDPNNKNELGYYTQVYNRDKSPRIYASEHTGLLERRKRENIENDFKERKHFNSLNVLVATSTLEMGIDIGTLNTAINNTIPPLPANYLQRIGRAGRSTGTALIMNFVKTQDHDLYYYDEPSKMMEGDIGTPGCYLEAKEILTRHFLAYCIDHWVAYDIEQNSIATFIRELKIRSLDIEDPLFFVNRLFKFIDANFNSLRTKFELAYTNHLTKEKIWSVAESFNDGSIHSKFKRVFERLIKEERQSAQRRRDIDKYIKEEKLAKEDPEHIALKSEIINLSRLWKSRESMMVLEYLTNVGLLPNYAFPETGVNLEALILPGYTDGIIQQERREELSITRGAGQAIKELAPDNKFFSQGHKLPITGLNIVDWADPQIKSSKRFCSKCDFIGEAQDSSENCPKCNHESYGSISNLHSFVKLTGVKSVVNKNKSRLSDDKDERDVEIYNISKHLDFSSAIGGKAYVIDGESFGIEYVSELNLRDINLGHGDSVSSDKSLINEFEVPSHGFVTCKYCGFSSSKPGLYRARTEQMHYGYCKHKMHEYKEQEDEVYEHIFLFREFKTEGLKIRVPRSNIDDNIDNKILASAIQVGLREFFKGSPSHIKIREYSEYNKLLEKFEQYIVLVDNIPGGSSYLENIFNVIDFNDILTLAFVKIRDCGCQHEDLDGCYKCIYTYENQYEQELLSRSRAVSIIEKLISKDNNWVEVDSLGSVANNGGLEESELEDRFTHWLENLDDTVQFGFKVHVGTEMEYDITVWNVTLENDDLNIQFSSRQQVTLGPSRGVKKTTRPDVLLTCESLFNKVDKSSKEVSNLPQIAIYLDGYRYHASKEHLRFYSDLEKRESLAESKRYIPWTLTWSDFDLYGGKGENGRTDILYSEINDARYIATRKALKPTKSIELFNEISQAVNSIDRLILLMANYQRIEQYQGCSNIILGMTQANRFHPSYNLEDVNTLLDLNLTLPIDIKYITDALTLKSGLVPYGGKQNLEFVHFRPLIQLSKKKLFYSIEPTRIYKDLTKDDWEYFWQIMNLVLLNEKYIAVEAEVVNFEFLELYREEYKNPIRLLIENNILTVTEETEAQLIELTDEKGKVIAGAELILIEIKEVFEPFTEEDERVFLSLGYKLKNINEFNLTDYLNK